MRPFSASLSGKRLEYVQFATSLQHSLTRGIFGMRPGGDKNLSSEINADPRTVILRPKREIKAGKLIKRGLHHRHGCRWYLLAILTSLLMAQPIDDPQPHQV